MESDVHKKIVSGRKGIMTDQVLVVESEMTTRKSTSNSSTIQLAPAQATAVIAEPELDGDLVRPRTAALAEERMTSARSATASTAALSARPGAEHGNFRRSEEVPNYISSTIVPRHDALQSVVCTSDHADHRNKGVSAARSGGDAARETTTVDKEQGATGMASVSVQQNQNRNRNNNSSTSSTSLERVPIHLQQHDEYRHETKNDVQVAGGKVSASTCTVAADLVQHPAANPNPSRSGGPAVQHQVDRYQSSATQDQPRQGELQLYNREPMIPPDTVTRVTKTKAAHSNSQKKKKKKKSSSKSAVTSPRPRVDEVPPEEVAPASASRATSCCLPSCLRRHLMMMRSSFVRSKDDDPRAAETTTTFSTRTLLSSRRRRLLSFRWWKELMCDKRPAHFRAGSTNNEESLTAPLQLELQHPWDADADRANSRGDALGGETSAISAVEDGATTYNATTAPALSSTGPSTSTGADERSFPAEGAGASHLQRRGTFCEEDDKKQMKLQSRRSTSSSRFSWWKVIVTLYLVLITMFVLRRALKIRRLKRKLRQAYALREVLARRARRRAAVMMRSDGHDSEETPHAGQRDLNYSVNRYSEDIDAVQLLASARPFSTSTTSGLPRAAGAKTSRRSSLYNNLHIKNLYAPDEDEHYDNKARREVGSSALFPWSSWSSDGVVSAGGATATAATTKKIHRKNNLRGSARLAALQQRSHSEDHAVPSDDVLATNREEKQDEPPSDHEGEVVPALEDPHAPPFGDVYLMKGKIASSSETEGEHQENYRETASEVVLPGRGDDHDLALPDAAAAQPRYRFRGTAAMRRKETQQAQEEAATQEEAAAPASSFLETSTGTHTEVARQETATQETARQETARQETARQETARQGTSGRQGTKAKQGFIDNIGDMPGDIGDTLFGMGWVTTFGAKDAVVNNLENVLDVGEQLAKPVEMFAQGTVSVGNELFVQHDLGGAWGEASHLVPQGRDFLVDTADDIVEAPANLIESALGFDIQWDKDWDFDFGDGDFGYVNFVKDEDTHDAQMDLANYGLNTVEWTVDTVTQPFDYMGQGLVNYVVDTFEVDNALGDLTNNAVIHGWDQEDWHDWLVHDPGSHFWDLNGDGTHAPNPLLFHGEAEGLTLEQQPDAMDALRHTKQDLQDLKATLIQALEDHNTEVGLDQREHVDNEEINKIQEALDKLDHIDPSNPDGDSKEWSGNIIHGAVKNKELLDNIQDITNGFKQDLDEHDGHWGQWLKTELGEEESGYLDLEAHPHTDELLKNYDFEHTAAENLEDWEKEKEHLERYQETSKEIHDLQDDITNHDATYCHERDTNSDYGEDFNYGFCMDQIDNNKMRLDDLQKQLDEQKATMPAELQHFVSDGSDKLHERLDVLNHITTLLENHPNVLEKENDPNLPDSLEYNPQGGQIMTQEYDWDQTLQENKDRWDDELARIKALPDNGSLRTSDDMKEVLGSDAPIKEHDQSESDYLDVLMQKIVIKKAALEEATTRPWTDEETSYIDSQKDRMDAADDKIAELRTSVEHMDRQHLGTLKEMEEDMREGNMDEIGAKIQADEEKEHNLRDMQTSMKTLINEVTDGDDKRALLARKEELDTAIATVRNVDKYDAKMNEYERLVSDALTEVKREHTIDAHDDLTDRHDAMKDILDGLARQTAGDSDDHERVVGWQTQLTEIQDAVDENQHPNPSQDDLDAQANKYKDLLDDIKDHVADADESAGGGNNGGHHDDNKIRIDHDNFEKLNEKHDAVERVVNDYQNVHDAEHTIGSPGDGHGAGENPEDTIFGHMEAARDSVQAIGEQQTQLYHDPRQLAASVLVGGGAWFWFGNKMYSKKYKEVLHPKKTSKKLISRGSAKRISLDLRDADQVAFDRRRNLSEEEMLKLRQQERQIAHYKQVGKLLDDKMASHGVEGYEDYSGYHYKVASDFTRLQEKLDEEGKVGRRPGLLSKVDIATLESDDNWQKVWWGPFETSMWQYVGEEMEIGTRVRLNERGELLIDEDGVLVEDWKKFTMEHNAMTSPLTRLTGQLLKWRGQSAGEIAMASERQLLASIDAEETRASWFWQAGWERDQEDDLLEQVKEKSKEALPMLLSTYYAQDSVMDPVALETQQIMEKWEEKALKDVKHLNGEDPNAENAEDGSAKMDALEAEALRPPEEWLQADPGAPESGVAPLQERLDKRAEVCSFENGRELENDKFCQLATDEVEKRKEELEKYWVTQIPKDKRMELVKQYKEQRKMKAEATKAEQGSGLLSSSSSAASSSSTAASASSFLQMSKTGERTEEQMEKNMEKHQTAREGLASGMMKVGEGGRVARRHAVAASTTSEQQEAKQEARARTGTRAAAKNKLLPASNDAGLLDEDVEESEFPKTTNALGLRADLLAHSGANSWSGRLFGGKDSTTSYRDTMFGDAFILLDPLRSYTKVDRYERGGDAGGSITSTRREGRTQAAREADATRNYFAAVGMVLPTKIREHLRFLMFLTPDECLPQPGQDTVLGYRYEMRNEGQILSDIDEERKKKERLATWNINELRQREVGSKITDHNANFLQDLTSATLEDLEDAAWGTCKDIHLSTSKLTTDKLGVSGVDGNIHPKIPLLAAEERINEYIRARRFRAEKFRDIMEDIYGDEMRYNYAFHLKTEGILQKQILKAEHLSDKVRERDIELEIQQMREQLEALEEGGDLYYHFADLDVDEDGNVITKECEPGDTECEELLRQHEEDLENQANGAAQAAAAAAASSATSSSSSAASMLQVKEQEELSTTSLVGGAVPDEAGAAKEIPEPVEKVTSSGRSATDVKTNTMSTSTTAHKLPAVAATSSAPGVQGSSQELAEPLGKLSSESSGARSSTENDALSGRGDGSSTSLGDSVLEVDTNMQAGATSSTSSQLQVGEAKTKTETARNHQKLARRTGGTSKSRSRTTSQERSLSVASSSSSSSFAEQKTAKKKELQSQLLEKVLLQKAMRQKRKRGRQRRAASSDADARKSTRSRSPDHVLEQDEHESSPPAGAQTSTSSSLLQHTVEEEQVQETKQGEEGKKTSAMKELKSRTTEREEMRLVARHRESKVPAERVQEAEEVEGELILKFMEQHKDFSQDWLAHYADNYSWETTPEQELRDDMFLNPQSNLNTRDRWTATNLLREIALVEWKKVAEYVIMVQTDQHSACGGNIGESRLYQRAGMDVRMAAGHITEHLAADLEYQQAALTETEDTPEEFKHNKYIGGDLIRGDVELPKSYLMSELHRAMEYVLVKEYTKPAKVHTLETEYQDRLLTERLKAKLGRKPSAGEVLAAEKRGTNKGLFDIFQARLLAEDVLERQVDNSDWKLKPQECGSIWKRIADAMYFEAASVYRNERNRMAHLLEEKPDIAMMVETDVTEEIENAWKHTRQTSKSMVEGEEDERDIDQYVAIKGEGEAELAFMHQIMFNKAMKVKKLSNQRYRIMKSAKYEKFLRPDLLRDSLIEDLHKEAGDTVEGVKDGIKFQRLLEKADMLDALQDVLRKAEEEYDKVKRDYELARKWDREANKWYSEQKKKDLSPMRAFWLVHNDYMIEEELLRKQMQSNLIDMQVGTFDNHLRIGNRIKQRVGFVIPTPPDERLDEEDYYHDDDRRAAGEDLTQFSWTVEKSNRLEHCPVELLAQLPEYARDSFEDEWTSSMTYEEKHKFAQTFLAKKHLELQNALVALEARQQVLAKLAIDFETKGREDYKAAVQEVTDRMVEKSGSSGQGPVNRRAATIKREKAAREKAGIKDGTATTIVRKNGNNKVEPSSGKNSKKTTEEVDDAKSKKHHSKKGTSSSSSRKNTSSKKEKESSSSRKSSSNSSKGKSKKKSASTASAAAASAAASFAEQMARLWTPTKSEDVGQEQEGEQGQGTTESVSGARNTTSATSSSATPLGGAGGGTTANPNGSRSPRPVRRLADRIQFLEETLRNMKLSAGRLSKLERLLFCVLFAIGLWLALVSVLRTCFGWCTTKSRSEEAAPLMSWWWWCSRSRTAINTSQQEALLAGEREKFRGLFYDSSDSEASSDYYDSDSDEDLQDEEERWEDGAKYENPPRPRAATTGLLCSITRRGGTSTTSDVLVVEDEAMASSSDEETVFEIANIIPEHKSS